MSRIPQGKRESPQMTMHHVALGSEFTSHSSSVSVSSSRRQVLEETCRLPGLQIGRVVIGSTFQLAPLLGSCCLAFLGRGHSWKSPLRERRFSCLQASWEIQGPREATREGTVTLHYSISQDSKERDFSSLPGSIFNAQAVVMSPDLGRH